MVNSANNPNIFLGQQNKLIGCNVHGNSYDQTISGNRMTEKLSMVYGLFHTWISVFIEFTLKMLRVFNNAIFRLALCIIITLYK